MPKIKLADISTRAPKEFDKEKTKGDLAGILKDIDELQNLLFASATHSLLVIVQGMDASGKDGAIRKVFTSINPQGVSVSSFKVPTPEEAAHDFLWRIHERAPRKGMIGIFNRSHYEDILVTRVHKWCDDETAKKRMKAINDFESLLQLHNNTAILKFYLHISKEEQLERLQERTSDPTKHWKYNANDFKEAERWDDYMKMYEDCFEKCDTPPWIIVPADQNWYKEFVMATTIRDTLKSFDMKFPALEQ